MHHKKGLKKEVKNLEKKVAHITPPTSTEISIGNGSLISFVGVAPTALLTAAYTVFPLTTLGQGVGDQQRTANRVKLKRLRGRLEVGLPVTALYANQSFTQLRAFILHVKRMPGTAGAHTYPVCQDIFQVTAGAMGGADIMAFRSIGLNRRNPEYRIVWDRQVDLSVAGASTLKCKKSLDKHADSSNYYGCATSYQFQYDFAPSSSITTFDDNTNSITGACENHYLLCVALTNNAANNVPAYSFNGQVIYESQ